MPSLDYVMQKCINLVGVDVLTGSAEVCSAIPLDPHVLYWYITSSKPRLQALSYVSGLGKPLAEKIISYREGNTIE